MVELSEIKKQLASPTLKHRKEGVKQLELQLSSKQFLRQLDVNTLKLWPEDKIQLMSWPGLADTLLSYLYKEVADFKKQLDPTALRVFKTAFTAADSTERCGPGRCNLLRRAGASFEKLGKVLEVCAAPGEGLATPVGKEIATVLLKVLLPNPAYCQRATVVAFQGVMEEVMLRLEVLQQQVEQSQANTAKQTAAATATGRLPTSSRGSAAPSTAAMQQEMYTMANLMAGLLAGVPGQMAVPFVIDVLAFLSQSLAWMDKQRDFGRVSRQLMACLNGLLLTYGADLRPVMPTTHKALTSYIKHAWVAHTSVPVKDGVLCYCRLSLALGGAPAASPSSGTSVHDLLNMVTRDINAPGFAWDLHNNKQHQQLAPLAASLFYHAAFGAASATTSTTSVAAALGGGGLSGAAAAEVGSCGSTGQASGRGAKRRSASVDAEPHDPAAAAADGGGSSDDEVLQLPRKRSRVLGPAGQLLMHLQTDPDRWAPVNALLLHQHGPLLPPSFLAALQQQLATSAARIATGMSAQGTEPTAGGKVALAAAAAAGARGGGMDRRSASPGAAAAAVAGAAAAAAAAGRVQQEQQLLWLSRCLCELALCWPAALHPLAGAADGACAGSSAAGAGAAGWEAGAGAAYDPSEGCCSQQQWEPAQVSAARGSSGSHWQQLWDLCCSMLAAVDLQAMHPAMLDSLAWLLHVLVACKLVQLPSKAAALQALQRLWLPFHHQQQQEGLDAMDSEQQSQQQQHQMLSDAQLALLLSLTLGQPFISQRELLLRQQLLQACLSTAEAWSSSSGNRRSSRHNIGAARPGGMGPPAAVAAAAAAGASPSGLPDLLLPAIVALLGAPDLPTPSLNGAPATVTMGAAADARLEAIKRSWCFSSASPPGGSPAAANGGGPAAAAAGGAAAGRRSSTSEAVPGLASSNASGCDTVWYSAAESWWWADQQLEAQLAGLETGLDTLRRQLAAEQLRFVLGRGTSGALMEAVTPSSASVSTASPGGAVAAAAAAEGAEAAAAPPGEAAGSSSMSWWKCWCRLADETAEHLCNALLPFTASGAPDADAAHPWGPTQDTVAAAAPADGAAQDPVKQLSYLLLLLNASINLPCIAALQFRLHQQQLQQREVEQHRGSHGGQQPDLQQPRDQAAQQSNNQQQQQQDAGRQAMFCGFGFSWHPEQHQQLQQLVLEAGIKAGKMLADNLHQLPCQPGSSWLQQMVHLGASLARIQALMTALPTLHGPDPFQFKYTMMAAASFLAEVVKVLERLTTEAADAANQVLEEAMAGGGGDEADLDDDFMIVAPPQPRAGSFGGGGTQQPASSFMSTPAASFRPSQAVGVGAYPAAAGRPAAGPAGAPTGPGAASGPAVFVSGGLAGFTGRTATGLGNPSAVLSPALLPPAPQGFALTGVQPGFAVGSMAEGLAGLGGVEGAGMRVFAALSPAYVDTAQALLRLWKHMAGLPAWAPPEALLQAVVETVATGVCAGGWSHLQQLFGLMKGSHTLLSAQKVPHSTSHLILRLLQQVAAAAAAQGLRLDVPCALPESQGSEDVADLQSQQEQHAGHNGPTYLSVMHSIFAEVQTRLGIKHDQPQAESHLPLSTQLQLGLTALALLQLEPQAVYAAAPAGPAGMMGAPSARSVTGRQQHAADLASWRQTCLLGLLSSPSCALRARAGPLAAALLTALAASAASPGSTANASAGSSSSSSSSVANLVKTALADISGHLFVQDSAELSPAQINRVQQRQQAQQQVGGPDAAQAKTTLDSTNREAQQDAIAWESAVLQLVCVARAMPAASCVALQQQEVPDVLDAQLLVLLLRHTASIQLLPPDVLPTQAGGVSSGGSMGSMSSQGVNGISASSGSRVRALHLAAVALDAMAAQQLYTNRFPFLYYHRRAWAREWVSAGCSVQQLLAVQQLLCPPAETAPGPSSQALLLYSSPALEVVSAAAAAGGVAGGAPDGSSNSVRVLLQVYGSSLLFWMVYFGAQADLTAMAAAAGLEEAVLLQAFTHELCSCVYPLLKVPELREQAARFRQKLPAEDKDIAQDTRLALVFPILERSLPVLPPPSLQQLQQPTDPRVNPDNLPYLTQGAADKSLATLASACKGGTWLAVLHLGPPGIQALLLKVHRSLVSAAHPLHKLQRLAQFQCLLRQLPRDVLQWPAVARSLASMLLQQLQVPEVQGLCCSCLHLLLSQLFADVPLKFDEQGRAVQQKEAKTPATGNKQLQQQLRQKQQEDLMTVLLQELLLPTMAALVQCIEAAAAGLQSQQQAQLWALQPSSAATAAAGAAAAQRMAKAAGLSGNTVAAAASAAVEPLDMSATWSPVALLHYVYLAKWQYGIPVLLELLPPLPVLSAASINHGVSRADLRSLVLVFAARAASMTASSRQRAVQEMLSLLSSGLADIYEPEQHSSGSTNGGAVQLQAGSGQAQHVVATDGSGAGELTVRPDVVAAAFQLARLGAELADAHVMQLAAELLAAVGPMDPDVITLDHAAAADGSSSMAARLGSEVAPGAASSSSSHADRTGFPLRAVLEVLVASMFDATPGIVSTAQATLASLVPAVGSRALEQALQPPGAATPADALSAPPTRELLLQSCVSTYMPAVVSGGGGKKGAGGEQQPDSPGNQQGQQGVRTASAEEVAAALEAAGSPQLWSPAGKSYKVWLCSLSSTMLRACGGVADAGAAATRRSTRQAAAATTGMPATSAVLAMLADAAAINAQLAELLLPHAVLKLCESDGSGSEVPGVGSQGWAARLADAAAAGLRLDSLVGHGTPSAPAAASDTGVGGDLWDAAAATAGATAADAGGPVDVRCYSVLLACLEHNRSVHRIAMMQMPIDPAPPPTAWQRSFCLHLDYLSVAAAAMAVKAYFTALLYVEQWCAEVKQTGLNPFEGSTVESGLLQLQKLAGLDGSANAATAATDGAAVDAAFQRSLQQQQQQLLERLLLELYSHVNEPDGVYAVVAAFGSPASELHLLKHEQQWAAVLGGQDALLQAAAMQPQSQARDSLQVTGALSALQHLGCHATAQQCITGALLQQQQQQPSAVVPLGMPQHARLVLPQQQQEVQQLLEAQHELTWRLSDWGLCDSLNPAGVAGGLQAWEAAAGVASAGSDLGVGPGCHVPGEGFHASVLAALTALQQRDFEGFSTCVAGGQQECVLRLARSSTQSAAAVNPLLVQLRMLQMLQMLSKGRAVAQGSLQLSGSGRAAAGAAVELLPPSQQAEGWLQMLSWDLQDYAPKAAAKLSGVSYELSDQLLSLQGALCKVLHRPDALVATLQASMRVARKAGQVNFAAAALQQLQETLHQAVLGVQRSSAGFPAAVGLGLHDAAAAAGGAGPSSSGSKLPAWLQHSIAADAGWPLESVKLRWLQGQHQAALKELQALDARLEAQLVQVYGGLSASAKQQGTSTSTAVVDSLACALMEARMLLGKWLAAGEGSISNTKHAIELLQQASQVGDLHKQQTGSECGDVLRLHSRVCYQLGACADLHYQTLDTQVASPEFQKQQQVLGAKETLLQQLTESLNATQKLYQKQAPGPKQQSALHQYNQVRRRYYDTQRQVNLDQQTISQALQSRKQYLGTALAAYRDCILAGDTHDLQVVYRMCGLWFQHSGDAEVNALMSDTFSRAPSAKFVPLVYQIASRMDNTNSEFQVVLVQALFLMARDHPYHTLYPIIALSNGDTEGGDPAAKNAHIRHQTNTARVAAANALLQKVRAVEQLAPIVDDMMQQVSNLIAMTLQVHKTMPRNAQGQLATDQFTMPANFIRKLKSLQHAPPICYSLPLDTACRYAEFVPHVVDVDKTVRVAGGVNLPLIVKTTDSCGRSQRQLCKCNDDLRQDAVMQQFFGLVDILLAGSPDSKQRRLGIRTYRVVPCSPLVGVLEWVEGTTPLTEYLLGERKNSYGGGMSARYHQGGLSWLECYLKMDKAQPAELKDTFLYCCQQFPPVFRHFFLEAFPHPCDWFEARTRYTRSVAVASMAGAVIGLGDRHLGNILLDTRTAEVVHIDLGIAFEQGLLLTTPERVPFRLTANIVDGMGAAGVEGTFRRCCETTLQVLRDHQDALLTVIQVLLHDPLYRWQMTPVMAGRRQLDPIEAAAAAAARQDGGGGAADAASGGEATAGVDATVSAGGSAGGLGNADAERVVLKVKQKLQGQSVEGGASLSVAAQVGALMQAAMDPDNLCRMFKGWAPWV